LHLNSESLALKAHAYGNASYLLWNLYFCSKIKSACDHGTFVIDKTELGFPIYFPAQARARFFKKLLDCREKGAPGIPQPKDQKYRKSNSNSNSSYGSKDVFGGTFNATAGSHDTCSGTNTTDRP
jgi:hypothetical protein